MLLCPMLYKFQNSVYLDALVTIPHHLVDCSLNRTPGPSYGLISLLGRGWNSQVSKTLAQYMMIQSLLQIGALVEMLWEGRKVQMAAPSLPHLFQLLLILPCPWSQKVVGINCKELQKDHSKLGELMIQWQMSFNAFKCKRSKIPNCIYSN